ncbi:hypothetical protein CDD83_7707 [Cordyceps sp. RAO-2017]|nr:hypothetical protein CDD83_7707 [Cordyceps sp. RAO-2017]
MGVLPGWWLGVADGRISEPCPAPERWDTVLKEAGFTGVEAATYDAPPPYHFVQSIVSRPAVPDKSMPAAAGPPAPRRRLTLLHRSGDGASPNVVRMHAVLGDSGFEVDMFGMHEYQRAMTRDRDIIVALVELETPFFEGMSGLDLAAFQKLAAGLGVTPVLWVMGPAQAGVGPSGSPGFGLTLGLMRSLRSEQPVAITTLEVDHVDDRAFAAVSSIVERLLLERTDGAEFSKAASPTDLDREFVLADGVVKVGRYYPVSLSQQDQDPTTKERKPGPLALDIGRTGSLQTLRWVPAPSCEPAHGEVMVEPRCAGLNFQVGSTPYPSNCFSLSSVRLVSHSRGLFVRETRRTLGSPTDWVQDVLHCMGLLALPDGSFGTEGSGVVTKVGSGVADLRPGDRVLYMARHCFSTQATMSAQRCVRIGPSLSWENAATMPCAYATAIHCLLDVGDLRPGQSILIHSACGGVGIAALNVCRSIGGLEVYATAGNAEKVKHLMDVFGLARDRIFSSRDTTFVDGVRAATGGRGVDLVLNSLSGELLHASWQCVAPYGKMLEISKRDSIGKARLGMDLFEANRSFIGIDVARFDAAKCHRLLQRTVDMFECGTIGPIEPVKLFEAADVEAAFRYMQQGTHLGKVVVSIPENGHGLAATLEPPQTELNPQGTYLLVGGLGGLGRVIATWMVERGARHLLFLSRSAGLSARDQAFFRELECQGCTARAVRGSVTDKAVVERAMASAPPDQPVRGVLQMSMVVQLVPVANMGLADWEASVRPKAEGTCNLHVAAPKDLDFFLALGSMTGSFGVPCAANYSAGNTYLTAVAQHRRALGLPASVLHLGFVEDSGYLARSLGVGEMYRLAGSYYLRTQHVLEELNRALTASKPWELERQLTTGVRHTKPLSDPTNHVLWKRDARMRLYHNERGSCAAATDGEDKDDTLSRVIAAFGMEPSLLDPPASLELGAPKFESALEAFGTDPLLKPFLEQLIGDFPEARSAAEEAHARERTAA